MQNTIAKDTLREYVEKNEVVFQAFGDLVEVANEAEKIWRMYQIAQDNGFTSFAEA